jgi:hypothetical protein
MLNSAPKWHKFMPEIPNVQFWPLKFRLTSTTHRDRVSPNYAEKREKTCPQNRLKKYKRCNSVHAIERPGDLVIIEVVCDGSLIIRNISFSYQHIPQLQLKNRQANTRTPDSEQGWTRSPWYRKMIQTSYQGDNGYILNRKQAIHVFREAKCGCLGCVLWNPDTNSTEVKCKAFVMFVPLQYMELNYRAVCLEIEADVIITHLLKGAVPFRINFPNFQSFVVDGFCPK